MGSDGLQTLYLISQAQSSEFPSGAAESGINVLMDSPEALALVKGILAPRSLNYIEEVVFCGSWENKRYREIAQETAYEEGYLKDIGSRLWQDLSEKLGCQVTKKRLHYILSDLAQSQTTLLKPLSPSSEATSVEFPGSPLPFGSALYIERPPIEALAVTALQQPGGLLRIMAPWRMGKTSLINYLLAQGRQLGQRTVLIDVRQADLETLENLDRFLRWFCWTISQQLGLMCNLDDYWFEAAGSKSNCTIYMQEYILAKLESPLVVAIDTVHYLVEHPHIAQNFLSLLRSWYEQAKVRPQWQKLRLLLAHVAELDLPLKAHQSPFNVGLLVDLPPFTTKQTHQLLECYTPPKGNLQEASSLHSLLDLVGGHPYLLQLAFYWLQSGQFTLSEILKMAATNQGIYHEYLRCLWLTLQQDDTSLKAFYEVLASPEPIYLSPKQAYALAGMGLVKLVGHKARVQCELYRSYFSPLLDLNRG